MFVFPQEWITALLDYTGAISTQGEALLCSPMTYSLFEFAKEKAEELIVSAPEEENAKVDPVSMLVSLLQFTNMRYCIYRVSARSQRKLKRKFSQNMQRDGWPIVLVSDLLTAQVSDARHGNS